MLSAAFGVEAREVDAADSPDPYANELSTGIGLDNTRRRLDLQYPGKHQLQITDRATSFEVLLHLNIEEREAESRYSR